VAVLLNLVTSRPTTVSQTQAEPSYTDHYLRDTANSHERVETLRKIALNMKIKITGKRRLCCLLENKDTKATYSKQ